MKDFIRYILKENLPKQGILIKEGVEISEGLQYHRQYDLPIVENVYRPFSDEYFSLINEARGLWKNGLVELCEDDEWLLKTDIGETAMFEGEEVWLDIPFLDESELDEIGLHSAGVEGFLDTLRENPEYIDKLGFNSLSDVKEYIRTNGLDDWQELRIELSDLTNESINEAEYRGRKVNLNSPFRTSGGPKKFAVYVKSPSGNVKIVRFGDTNLRVRNNNAGARKSFRARHKCDQKKDKTKAGYWACNVARYRKKLGIKSSSPW
jgi:hypothetical protein